MAKDKILVIGANGQIGTVLLEQLRNIHGTDQVIGSDIVAPRDDNGLFVVLDATNVLALVETVHRYGITQIYHLAAVLSAKGELDPLRAWELNMRTLFNVFEVAREVKLDKVFFPSSIAAFGDSAPQYDTPQATYLDPSTVYGISKVAGENWAGYYHKRYGVDIRSLRYPGVISYQSMPGGGTTDYAVEIFHEAVQHKPYTCFLHEDTLLPMIYMDDAIRATLELMEAPVENIRVRSSYNLAGVSFTPAQVTAEIKRYYPDFEVQYQPDFRQMIADSWPKSVDDTAAYQDWGWKPQFDLARMTQVMIEKLSEKYQQKLLITQ
ncbi:NAD-dependent epimerase/dehydratase family protein [Flectobacillus longus]|uniref:NAD-dependent epimerase/dehydratase family protein n=1 Tax=Flectobacillus longus TaxID=2984207 RepID=UPI0024B6DDB9|nr:NAD-dependent epimerase/dehydratase family protein [Flectobacillus longus]MDI9878383.1 NAD-dependent epimerase/dehydratase family protein [Flectobacillus longus]